MTHAKPNAPMFVFARFRPMGQVDTARPHWLVPVMVCLAFCLAGMASVLWPEPVAAQAPITTNNPCFAGENLTQQTGTAVRGITNQPVISRNGTRLAFWSTNDLVPPNNADGNIEIFVKELTGTRTVWQLTDSVGSILGGFNLEPSINAGGTHIAFYSDRDLVGRNADGNFEIFLARLSSGNWTITQVTDTVGSANLFPSISGVNGGVVRIAFASDDKDLGGVDRNPFRNFEIFLATIRNGTVQIRQITNSPAGTTSDQPAISAAGTRIVYTAGAGQESQVYVWDEGSNTPTQLTNSGNNTQPAINADGTNIVYIGTNSQGRTRVVLHTLSADGTESRSEPIVNAAANTVHRSPTLSDDGTRVVYVSEVGTGDNRQVSVVLYDLAVGLPVVISQLGDGTGEQPAISGDGTRISFVGSRSVGGNTDVVGSDIYVNECPLADLTLEFAQTPPATVLAGANLTLTLRVTNNGPSVAQDAAIEVNLTDVASLPANVNRVLPANQCRSLPNGDAACTLGNLDVGQSVTRQFVFEIPSNAGLADIEYAYAVTANAVDQNDADNSTGILSTRVVEEAALKLAVTAGPSTIVAGSTDVLTYDLLVTNGGPSQARGTVLTDTLPTGSQLVAATLVSGGGAGVTCPATANNVRVTCRLGNMLAGSSAHVRVQVNALPGAPANFVNVAEVQSLTGELNKNDNKVTTRTPISRSADMQISISAFPVDEVNAGEYLTYTVVVTNAGLAETEGVVVIDALPPNFLFFADASSTDGGSCVGTSQNQSVTCTVPGTMGVGAVRTISYVVFVDPAAVPGDVENTARVTSQRADPNPDNNESNPAVVRTVNVLADVFVTKGSNKSVYVAGEQIVYTLRVQNAGPSQATQLVVTDTLPDGAEVVSASGCSVSGNGDQVTCSAATLAPGSNIAYTVIVTRGLVGTITNTVSVAASSPDLVTDNNTTFITNTINPDVPAQLTFEQQPPAEVIAGEPFTPTVRVAIRDRFGNLVNTGTGSNDQIQLTAYSDPSCTTAVASAPITGNQESAAAGIAEFDALQYTRAETIYLRAEDLSRTIQTACSTAVTVNAAKTAQILFTNAPVTVTAGVTTSLLTVERRDQFGNPNSSDPTLTLLLTSSSGGSAKRFILGANGVTQVEINPNSAVATFYYYDELAGTHTLTAADAANELDDATQNVRVEPDDATQLVVVTAAQVVTAGVASDVITVERQDQFGNPDPNAGTTTVALSGLPDTGEFLEAASPVTITTVTITETQASFRYSDTVAGPKTLTLDDGGVLADTTHAITITADTAKQLVFTAAPASRTADDPATGPFTLERLDQFGNANATDPTLVVNLTSDSIGGIFSGSPGGLGVSAVDIVSGTSTIDFYYRDTLAGTHVITADGAGPVIGPVTTTITVEPGAPAQLVFLNATQTITAGTTSGEYVVELQDAYNNPTTPTSTVNATLLSTSPGPYGFLDAPNGSPKPVLTYTGNSRDTFFYTDQSAGQHNLTADASEGEISDGSQVVNVVADTTDRIVFLTGPQVVTAGQASPLIVVERQDQFGNANRSDPTLTLNLTTTALASGAFLTDTQSTPITQVSIAPNSSQAAFRYTDTVRSTVTITVSDAGAVLTPTAQAYTVQGGPAAYLQITGPVSTTAGTPVAITVTARDQFGNQSDVFTNQQTLIFGGIGLAPNSAASQVTDLNGDGQDIGQPTNLLFNAGVASPGTQNVLTIFDAGSQVLTATVASTSIQAIGGNALSIQVDPAAPSVVRAETLPSNGSLVALQTLSAGETLDIYAVSRDQYLNETGPVPADWALTATGGVQATDIAPTIGVTMTTFSARLVGTAIITPTFGGLIPTGTGLLTVEAGAAVTVSVETAADGSGAVVPSQTITSGDAITVYAVTRDQFGNWTGNPTADWAMINNTGVADDDLDPTDDSPSTTFTADQAGTGQIQATVDPPLVQTPSGVITVVAGLPVRLALTTENATTVSAGASVPFTLTAYDAGGNVATGYNGVQTLIFSGASPSLRPVITPTVTDRTGAAIDFGQPTELFFTNGVATPATTSQRIAVYLEGQALVTAQDATNGTLSTDVPLTITVNGLTASRLDLDIETPTPVYTAGVGVRLTIRAVDPYGNLDELYDGNKNLDFQSDPPATALDGTKSYVLSGHGTPQQIFLNEDAKRIVFDSGVAATTAGGNGILTIFKSGEFVITTSQDGSLPSGSIGAVTVTVVPSPDQVPVLSLVSPQVNGQPFTEPGNRIEIQDVYSNVVTGFDASQHPVTLTVEAPLAGTIALANSGNDNVLDGPGEFSSGVAQLNSLGLVYTGTAGTGNVVATMANPAGGTSSDAAPVTINPAAPVALEIQGRVGNNPPTSALTVTAGTPISLTLRAYDFSGNLATNYGATPGLTFAGAAAPVGSTPPDPAVVDVNGIATRFGVGTSLQFSGGVVQVAGNGWNGTLRMYVPGTYQIAVSGGGMTPANQLTVHVVPGPVASYDVSFVTPQTLGSAFTGTNTVTARDAYNNVVTNYDGAAQPVQIVPLSPLTGTISGLSGAGSDIIAAGDWSAGVATLTTLVYDTGGVEQTGALQAIWVGASPPVTGDSQSIEFVAAPP